MFQAKGRAGATATGCAVSVSGRQRVYLATHCDARPMDRFRTFRIASGNSKWRRLDLSGDDDAPLLANLSSQRVSSQCRRVSCADHASVPIVRATRSLIPAFAAPVAKGSGRRVNRRRSSPRRRRRHALGLAAEQMIRPKPFSDLIVIEHCARHDRSPFASSRRKSALLSGYLLCRFLENDSREFGVGHDSGQSQRSDQC